MKKPVVTIGAVIFAVWLIMLGMLILADTRWLNPVPAIIFWAVGIASGGIILTGLFSKD